MVSLRGSQDLTTGVSEYEHYFEEVARFPMESGSRPLRHSSGPRFLHQPTSLVLRLLAELQFRMAQRSCNVMIPPNNPTSGRTTSG
jgi:hypothetical protein